ncbi:helix-turn-helix domain-containing protein [Sphingosinicella sp. CPCC 101087]|uniref:winged helix-turn-helix transcriptional regulator n=1 Tax=Sphingosinicella sp. CPCC 101087 TaxID=2497754 RepID=UPI00101CEDE4|nr:helix-turn-helix domain-containing protein [Sphingosinicella sp. CPCC 101087]
MVERSYSQFCPVAMAAEILCTRWTILILRELLAGSARFNELRRGVPRMSPALLSQRLKALEAAGIVRRRPSRTDPGLIEYGLTEAGLDLGPLVEGFGHWGQRWVRSELSLERLDASLLMWDMRRNLRVEAMGRERGVIQFRYAEQAPGERCWWLLIDADGAADLCLVDPGFDVDLYVATDLRTMTAIWMGADTVRQALADRRLLLTGDPALAASMQEWLGLSPFARSHAATRAVAGEPVRQEP